MGRCVNHPERETSYCCQKHGYYLCEQCLQCRDPKLYCAHRSACIIHFLTKGKRHDSPEAREEPSANSTRREA